MREAAESQPIRESILMRFCVTPTHWLIAFAACAPIAAHCTDIAPWTTFQGNARHTGYVPVALDPSQFALVWKKKVNNETVPLQPVTIANGMIYASQYGYFSNQGLYVLNAKDGKTIWGIKFPGIYSVNPPAYDSGLVYVQTVNNSGDSWLRAYDAASGTLAFKTAQGAQWERYMAPTIVDQTVYVNGGSYGGMYSFDGKNGSSNWFVNLPQVDGWTPAVDGTYAYVFFKGTGLQAISRKTGNLAFTIEDPGSGYTGATPMLGSKRNAIVISNGSLANYDLVARKRVWDVQDGFSGQPALAAGVIYAVNNGTLSARREKTGVQLWAWEPEGDAISGSVVATDSHVFVTGSQRVYAIDIATHLPVWSYPATGSLAWSEGALYLAGTDGYLTAISTGGPGTAGADLKLSLDLKPKDDEASAFVLSGKVRNKGPQDSGTTKLKFNLPRSFAVKNLDSNCTFSDNTITCRYKNIGEGEIQPVKIHILAGKPGKFKVSASVTGQRSDTAPGNNQDELIVTVD